MTQQDMAISGKNSGRGRAARLVTNSARPSTSVTAFTTFPRPSSENKRDEVYIGKRLPGFGIHEMKGRLGCRDRVCLCNPAIPSMKSFFTQESPATDDASVGIAACACDVSSISLWFARAEYRTAMTATKTSDAPGGAVVLWTYRRNFFKATPAEPPEAAVANASATVDHARAEGAVRTAPTASTAASVEAVDLTPRWVSKSRSFSRRPLHAHHERRCSVRPRTAPTSLKAAAFKEAEHHHGAIGRSTGA